MEGKTEIRQLGTTAKIPGLIMMVMAADFGNFR